MIAGFKSIMRVVAILILLGGGTVSYAGDIVVFGQDMGNGLLTIGYEVVAGAEWPTQFNVVVQLDQGAVVTDQSDVMFIHPDFIGTPPLSNPFGLGGAGFPTSQFAVTLQNQVPNTPAFVPDLITIQLHDGGNGATNVNIMPDGLRGEIKDNFNQTFNFIGYPPPFPVSFQQPPGSNLLEPPNMSHPASAVVVSCPTTDFEFAGNSVYLHSGEFYQEIVDMHIEGRGTDFTWARKYRSRVGPVTAMGNGWDYSYNVGVQPVGPDLVLLDGNTRDDVYTMQPDGTWAAEGFFRVITLNDPNDPPNSPLTLTFADTSTWQFLPIAHPDASGKISAVTDRNGNSITFEYDNSGKLTTIQDSLHTANNSREITIAYNGDDLISSVTDWTGRSVTYDYYEDGDAGGSAGDLKSVTTPTVTGTATGNDFPSGKTTTYTYSTGFGDEQLNHNLLTITDPKGQTYLTNIYAPDPNPLNPEYDHVITQNWGDPGDTIDFVYIPTTPEPSNGGAVSVAITNDRVGNVAEYFFDDRNQCVLRHDYTGRANPTQPTTDSTNRPAGKLRASDPDFFEQRWDYNDDSRPVLVTFPRGNAILNVYAFDLDPNISPRSRGNLVERHRLPGPLQGVTDPNVIIETFEYDSDFGGCCGTNFVTRHVDGRGNETLHTYDNSGNRTHTQHRVPSVVEDWEYNEFGQMTRHTHPDNGSGHRRVDIYSYYGETLPTDLNKDTCVNYLDYPVLALPWLLNGNSVADIAPPGGDGVVNLQDLLAFSLDWLAKNPSGLANHQNGYLQYYIVDVDNLALTTSYEYDAVGNIVRRTDPRGNDLLHEYNQLDQVVRELSREVTDGSGVRYERLTYYDGNDNVVRVDVENRDETGTLQANTHFTTIHEYEILNNRVRTCSESGDYTGAIPGNVNLPVCTGLPDPNFITVEFEYDGNRNRTLIRSGEAAEGRQPTNTVTTLYDERDLLFQTIRAAGDPDQSTIQCDYDANRNKTVVREGLEDTPRVTFSTYDGYDRAVSTTDPMGNVESYTYDANHNLVSERTDGDPNDLPGNNGHLRLYEKTNVYDALDRVVQQEIEHFDVITQAPIDDGKSVTMTTWSDNSQVIERTNDNAHTSFFTYDTANRQSLAIDAKDNVTEYQYDLNSNVVTLLETDKSDTGAPDQSFTNSVTYDGLDRVTSTTDNAGNTMTYRYDSRDNQTGLVDSLLRETRYTYDGENRVVATTRDLDGDGADGDGVDIVLTESWDDNSRATTATDGNGNVTTHTFDALNRLVTEVEGDTTTYTVTYDVHDNKVSTVDGNGTVTVCTFDLLNRISTKAITVGAGVSNDTNFENYHYDGFSRTIEGRDDDAAVSIEYDSLSNVTRETLNGQTTTNTYDGVGNKLTCSYPGGRVITCTYDSLERLETVSDGLGTIATYNDIGPDRVEGRQYGNGTGLTYTYDGITGVPNPAGDSGVKRIIRMRHTLNVPGDIDERTYSWDSMFNKTRKTDERVSGPQITHNYTYDDIYRVVQTIASSPFVPVLRSTGYDLDGAGNRTNVTGTLRAGAYVLDATAPDPADAQVNQYTTTPFDTRQYDHNGNLIRIDANLATERVVEYDYRNRMATYTDAASSQTHTYAYDPFGRRITRVVDSTGTAVETRYYYDQARVIEERDGTETTTATYVYGRYIDEVLTMHRSATNYYYHCDELHNVVALTDDVGTVIERYEYDDYGQPVDTATLAPLAGSPSAAGNPYLFTGRRYDPETGWYYYRDRYLDPLSGRFTARDSIGTWGDAANMGNGYTYTANSPANFVDPTGQKRAGNNGRLYEDSRSQSYAEGDDSKSRGMGLGERRANLKNRMKKYARWSIQMDYDCVGGKPVPRPGSLKIQYRLPGTNWNLFSRTPPKPAGPWVTGPTIRSKVHSIDVKGISIDFDLGIEQQLLVKEDKTVEKPCPKGFTGYILEVWAKVKWIRKDKAAVSISKGPLSSPQLKAIRKRTKSETYVSITMNCCECIPVMGTVQAGYNAR